MLSSRDIRQKFIKYFESKGHIHVPSSPVVPHDDPTLLFCNAGMNQFKDIFLGKQKSDYSRAVTSQKCIRVGGKHNDLDNVGHTSRHMTFFEMLGNFSFGDYFKKEAIAFAFEVAMNVFEFEKDRLYVSVFESDDEAFELWREHISEKRIIRLGASENFWTMGPVGPCGPCSELLYDRGPNFGPAKHPLEDPTGERYPEFWNLVFMQYNQDEKGRQTTLPKQSIDTGAGLERVLAFKQGFSSAFETDILQGLIRHIESICNIRYEKNSDMAPAFHVIADHIRALSFAIADGAQPSNIDRGYVLRKILRRAVRYAKRLKLEKPFLADLVPTLVNMMGDDYPELKASETRIQELLTIEEESFIRTLRRGGNILGTIIESARGKKNKQISGEDAFKLKDTYGFPLEEILLIAKDTGLEVNIESFELLEHKAKQLSKTAHTKHAQVASESLFEEFSKKHGTCSFKGYEEESCEASIVGILKDGKFVDRLDEGESGEIFLEETPFYAEKGGQVGDIGTLKHHSADFEVTSCKTPYQGLISHIGECKRGSFLVGEPVVAQIDGKRRSKIAANHSATHLLHKALSDILGSHIKQAGSLVEPDRLRFDFHHHKALELGQIRQIEHAVNIRIAKGSKITTREIAYKDAQKDPEIKQFFGDKYGSVVRVVEITEGGGKELCGGTHAKNISSIGLFRITKESSIGAGIRRIEAVTGKAALEYMYEQEDRLYLICSKMDVDLPKLESKVDSTLEEISILKNEIKQMKKERARVLLASLPNASVKIKEKTCLFAAIDFDPKEIGNLAQDLMDKLHADVVFLVDKTSCQMVLKLSANLTQTGEKAGDLIRKVARHVKGSGGGRPDMAQGKGEDPSGIPLVIEELTSHFSHA
jgi:alanyl-tRNA synthetase